MSIKNMKGLTGKITETLGSVTSLKDSALAQFENPLAEASALKLVKMLYPA